MDAKIGKQAPKLSIVVGTYNRFAKLRRCVESVQAQTKTPHHIYITDAGSTDGTTEYLESISSDQITPIFVGERIGQARALNQVCENLTSPYVAWLSDDNEVVDGGLDRAVAVLEHEIRVGMVGLKVLDIEGPFMDGPYIGGVSVYGVLNVNQGVLHTDLLRSLGYFSEEFRDYGIDPDLTAKVLLSGFDIVFTRDVAIHHFRDWDTDVTSAAYAEMNIRQQRYLKKYKELYGDKLAPTLGWLYKRIAWRLLASVLRLDINSKKTFLGMNVRDWHNCIRGRYIRVLPELLSHHKPYHLRQRSPKKSAKRRIC